MAEIEEYLPLQHPKKVCIVEIDEMPHAAVQEHAFFSYASNPNPKIIPDKAGEEKNRS